MFIYFYTSLLNSARTSILDLHVPRTALWRLVSHINAIAIHPDPSAYSKQHVVFVHIIRFVNRVFYVIMLFLIKFFYIFLIYHIVSSPINRILINFSLYYNFLQLFDKCVILSMNRERIRNFFLMINISKRSNG